MTPGTRNASIRNASADDRAAILEINAACVPGVAVLTGHELTQLMRGSALFRVIEIGEQVAGYLCAMNRDSDYDAEEFLRFRRKLRGNFLYIDQIAIRPSCRRRGLALALYDDLERFAATNAICALTCEVNVDPPNVPSQSFHAQCGFVEVDRMHARGLRVALLAKRLSSAACPTGASSA